MERGLASSVLGVEGLGAVLQNELDGRVCTPVLAHAFTVIQIQLTLGAAHRKVKIGRASCRERVS